MPVLRIDQEKVDPAIAARLQAICPFGALDYDGQYLQVNAGCKLCRLCVKNGPAGVIELVETDAAPQADKGAWRGVAVYAEQREGRLHKVSLELIGKARELAAVTGHPVYALLLGHDISGAAAELLHYGVDKVYVYDYAELAEFRIDAYTRAFVDFIQRVRPSSILVGATNIGRCLAPRTAARMRTGLTADCTVLQMKENTDLVQIRPAFGGNIMAQIVTPDHRPQFCTVRYKVFSPPKRQQAGSGDIVAMSLPEGELSSAIHVLERRDKPREVDISEADIIVACGRGFRKKDDLALAERLAELLGGVTACTRPLVEEGWMDPKRQIGLSGRTVKAKLIITLGISGAVQFAAGMKGSQLIVAVNEDEKAPIFDVAHYGLVGDIYAVTELLTEELEGRSRA